MRGLMPRSIQMCWSMLQEPVSTFHQVRHPRYFYILTQPFHTTPNTLNPNCHHLRDIIITVITATNTLLILTSLFWWTISFQIPKTMSFYNHWTLETVSTSSTYQSCSTWYRSSDSGGQWRSLNSLSCSQKQNRIAVLHCFTATAIGRW